MSKNKPGKLLVLLAVLLMSTMPPSNSNAQLQEDTWKTLASMPAPGK